MNLRSSIALVALGFVLTFLAAHPSAQALDRTDYTGRVGLVAGDYCPQGTTEADGAMLNIADYSVLFSLLGNTFGGDGKTTFALPDLRQKAPAAGMRYCIVVNGIYPSRN